ncbi:hypothetical protein CIHG_10487 [Coccidioides immitis H538.4]|uniref:Uncharacterized protein n=1 Tax=Coccidioides immitis H538.4 TaxID=396776 RepID=A0A0J8S6B0_COCIT|nr:hypothetical protein CIHG_10487 [Coccidioides immitis H538.4]
MSHSLPPSNPPAIQPPKAEMSLITLHSHIPKASPTTRVPKHQPLQGASPNDLTRSWFAAHLSLALASLVLAMKCLQAPANPDNAVDDGGERTPVPEALGTNLSDALSQGSNNQARHGIRDCAIAFNSGV